MRMLLHDRIRDSYVHPQFIADVIKPLQIEPLFDQEVGSLGAFYTLGGCCCCILLPWSPTKKKAA